MCVYVVLCTMYIHPAYTYPLCCVCAHSRRRQTGESLSQRAFYDNFFYANLTLACGVYYFYESLHTHTHTQYWGTLVRTMETPHFDATALLSSASCVRLCACKLYSRHSIYAHVYIYTCVASRLHVAFNQFCAGPLTRCQYIKYY